MEGIADGMAVDDCFYCTLLYPDLEACPRCENRFRYRPARMRIGDSVEPAISDAISAFQRAPNTQNATVLLELWHELGEEAEPFAIATRVTSEQLRAHFAAPDARAGEDHDDSEAPTS